MERELIWFNIHIPKCAGSTFAEILKRNFGNTFGDGRSYLSDVSFKYEAKHLSEIHSHFPYLRCFSDHKLSIDIPFDVNNGEVKAIAFVRNPVDRLISHYFYTRNQEFTNFDPQSKLLDLNSYIEECLLKNKRYDLKNGQHYHLTGHRSGNHISKVKQLVLEGKLLLFNVDRFKEACIILENTYPGSFKECSYIVKNRSKKDQKISDNLLSKVKNEMDLDFQLLDIANTYMNEVLENCFSDNEARNIKMKAFDGRCLKLQQQSKPSLKSKLINRIKKL